LLDEPQVKIEAPPEMRGGPLLIAVPLPLAPPEVQAEIDNLREQIAFHARKGRTTFQSERLAQILELYSEVKNG